MTDPDFSSASRTAAADGRDSSQLHVAGEAHRELTPDQISRWAQLVADGQEPFPGDLSPAAEQRMLQQVRELRRRRLVQYIAAQIANDIAGRGCHGHGGPS